MCRGFAFFGAAGSKVILIKSEKWGRRNCRFQTLPPYDAPEEGTREFMGLTLANDDEIFASANDQDKVLCTVMQTNDIISKMIKEFRKEEKCPRFTIASRPKFAEYEQSQLMTVIADCGVKLTILPHSQT